MNWIKSNEREPLNEGKYHCKHNDINVIYEFVKIQPNKKKFVINEHYSDDLLKEITYWTTDVLSAKFIKSNENLIWLDESL